MAGHQCLFGTPPTPKKIDMIKYYGEAAGRY